MGRGEPPGNWRSTLGVKDKQTASQEVNVLQEEHFLPHTKSLENLAAKSIDSDTFDQSNGSIAKTDRALLRNNATSQTQS